VNALSQNADSLAGGEQAGDTHYLRAVTDMAQRCTLVARDALSTS